MDWSGVGAVHVADDEVVPGAVYEIEAIDLACGPSADAYFSDPLTVATARWGDITGDCSVNPCTRPDGTIDYVDIAAVVDKFRNLPPAPIKARADLAPAVPDRIVDMDDVARVLSAFRAEPYPFSVSGPCQSP